MRNSTPNITFIRTKKKTLKETKKLLRLSFFLKFDLVYRLSVQSLKTDSGTFRLFNAIAFKLSNTLVLLNVQTSNRPPKIFVFFS